MLALFGGDPVRKTPFPDWPFYQTGEEAEALVAALKSDHLCGAHGGEQIPAFEAEFAAWCGAAGAVAVNSGSSALLTALAAVGVGPGDEVIVPAYTYYSSATAILDRGAIPVFADMDRETANIDPEHFRALVTERTRAAMPVHTNGNPVDMDAIMAIAQENGVAVVEDCSHAHGAVYRGKRVGTIGDVGAFSIQHKKILSVGEGGIVVSRDPDVVDRARAYANLGGGTNTGVLGPNLRMGELHAALARVRMKRVDAENEIRRKNAQILREAIADLPGIRSLPRGRTDGVDETYYNFEIDFDPSVVGVDRRRFAEALKAEGIPIVVGFYRALNTVPVFRDQAVWPYKLAENQPIINARELYGAGRCPVTEDYTENHSLELKVHPPCGEREMLDAAAAMKKVIAETGSL